MINLGTELQENHGLCIEPWWNRAHEPCFILINKKEDGVKYRIKRKDIWPHIDHPEAIAAFGNLLRALEGLKDYISKGEKIDWSLR